MANDLAKQAHKAVHDSLVTGASPSLQATLAALINGRVFDRIQLKPEFPYLVIEVDVRDDATTCSQGAEVHATVHVWDTQGDTGRAVGSIRAKEIGGLVSAILAPLDPDDAPDIDGFFVQSADLDVELYRAGGGDPLLTEGVLTFTYLVDPET